MAENKQSLLNLLKKRPLHNFLIILLIEWYVLIETKLRRQFTKHS